MAETMRKKCIRLNKMMNDNEWSYRVKQYQIFQVTNKLLPAHIIASKAKAYCSHCGSLLTVLTQKECPYCHHKFGQIERVQRASRSFNYDYLCVMTVMEDLQLLRFFYVGYDFKPYARTDYRFIEVQRQFINSDGKRYCFALSRPVFSGGKYDAWSFGSEIKIRDHRPNFYGYYGDTNTPRFDLRCGMTIIEKTIPLLRRNGLRKSLHGTFHPVSLVLSLLKNNTTETLWKSRQYHLADFSTYNYISREDMASVRICCRNHYYVKDAKLWIDHMQTLRNLHLDTRNAKYVCPKDLQKEHQVLDERYRRICERLKAERIRMDIEHSNKSYIEQWGKVLPLSITGQNLIIRPLQSVAEFKEEGDAMHHCVFRNEYYKSQDCIILSAKDNDGKRLATIEFDVKRMKIVQCRAVCNSVPERDEEIRQLVNYHCEDIGRLLAA